MVIAEAIMGFLGSVTIGRHLVQIQTEIIDGISPFCRSIAILNGRILRSVEHDLCEHDVSNPEVVHSHHKSFIEGINNKFTNYLAKKRTASPISLNSVLGATETPQAASMRAISKNSYDDLPEIILPQPPSFEESVENIDSFVRKKEKFTPTKNNESKVPILSCLTSLSGYRASIVIEQKDTLIEEHILDESCELTSFVAYIKTLLGVCYRKTNLSLMGAPKAMLLEFTKGYFVVNSMNEEGNYFIAVLFDTKSNASMLRYKLNTFLPQINHQLEQHLFQKKKIEL